MVLRLTASDYIPLADLISVYFQIRDDYMNLQSDQVSWGKLSKS